MTCAHQKTWFLESQALCHTTAQAITVAEDVSGMPALGLPVSQGGTGFDYRLGMGLPDMWTRLVKEVRDNLGG